MRPTYELSPDKSDFLNFVRWMAALVVVMGHADMYLGLFGGGNPADWSAFGYFGAHAHAAVIVFFVLSGYVVAYATVRKCSRGGYGFRDYFLDRWSRIYSVLLAAIGFTLALDYIGSMLSTAYTNPAFIPQDDFALRLIANLLGIQGIWGYRIQLGSNPALWSVGYEFIYYILFGALYFRAQLFRRVWVGWLIVAAVLGLVGWKIAVYFGVWLAGVAAYHVSRSRVVVLRPISAWLVVAMLLAANHLLVYSNYLNVNEVLRDLAFAVVIAVLLSFEIKQIPPFIPHRARINSYMADFSYSIYAFHTPIIFFLCSLLFESGFRTLPPLISGFILMTVSVLAARILFHIIEARRITFRQVADRLMRRIGL
jgi:peptidoglycan/LPS O-acetylase OafA/YrhL